MFMVKITGQVKAIFSLFFFVLLAIQVWGQPCPVNPGFSFVQYCDSVVFTDNSTVTSGSITDWLWDFGDGNSSTDQNPTHNYTSDGDYYVSLTVTHSSGCDTTAYDTVYVYHPVADFYADTTCYGNLTHFTDASSTPYGIVDTWMWDFGDGTSTQQNPSHQFTSQGIHDVEQVVENDLGCTDTIVKQVRVDSLPIAHFIYSAACLGKEVCFYDYSLPKADSIINWIWTIDLTTTIEGEDTICWTFETEGEHIVNLTVVNSNGCFGNKTDTVNVSYSPVAAFTASQACFNDSTEFDNETDDQGVAIQNWFWNFDDPLSGAANTSTLFEPQHLFSAPGSYDVMLTAENVEGCIDTIVNQVVVDSIPEAEFTYQDAAVGNLVEFFDESVPHGAPILNTFWTFGDGTSASNPNPVYHIYEETGTYEVMLVVTDVNYCRDTVYHDINITGSPMANFSYVSNDVTGIFTDESIPYEVDVPITKWFWNFGDLTSTTDTSSLQNPTYPYPETGYYDVFLRVTDVNGGVSDTTITVYIGKALTAYFEPQDVCYGDSSAFLDYSDTNSFSPIERWYWDFGDGNDLVYFEKQDVVRHYYESTGKFYVTLIVFDNEFGNPIVSDTMMDSIYVYQPPTAKFDSVGVCFGEATQFVDQSQSNGPAIMQWHWDFGDGYESYSQNPLHIYSELGTYQVQLEVTNVIGCTDTTSNYAYVNLAPNPVISYEGTSCVKSPIQFYAVYDSLHTEVTQWNWYFDYPLADSSHMAFEQNPEYTYKIVDLYEVRLEASAYGCDQDTGLMILVYPIPFSEFEIKENFENVQGRVSFYNSSVYALEYLWDFGNGNTSTEVSPIEVYEEDSTFTVTLIAYNEYGCTDTSTQEVDIYFKGLYIPTAFSPNNPNKEISLFSPKGINIDTYSIQVFDHRGNLIWESTEVDEYGRPAESWDGYYQDRLMPQGAYFWKAKAVFRDGTFWDGINFQSEQNVTEGTVTLIR